MPEHAARLLRRSGPLLSLPCFHVTSATTITTQIPSTLCNIAQGGFSPKCTNAAHLRAFLSCPSLPLVRPTLHRYRCCLEAPYRPVMVPSTGTSVSRRVRWASAAPAPSQAGLFRTVLFFSCLFFFPSLCRLLATFCRVYYTISFCLSRLSSSAVRSDCPAYV